jgi:hypothetical protein
MIQPFTGFTLVKNGRSYSQNNCKLVSEKKEGNVTPSLRSGRPT